MKNIADVITALKEVQEKFNIKPGPFIMPDGYDPNTLKENRGLQRNLWVSALIFDGNDDS